MKAIQPAAANPAGAGPLHAQTSYLIALVSTGALALDLWRAEQACAELREIYLCRIRQYEGLYGTIDGRINPRDPKYIGIISYTMDERASLTTARRKVHAARRRLRAACAKAAREGAANA
jgi:hypothetical protein